jgi:hypothetical protein
MKSKLTMTFAKRMGMIAIVLGTLFTASASSTFAQGRYHYDNQRYDRSYQSGGQKAATIGGGAAIGAIIGSIAGGGRGALIGGLIGAGVGTGVVVHKNNEYRNDYYYDRSRDRVYRDRNYRPYRR